MSRPLWQLLLAAQQTNPAPSLTCDECFTILGYLAELMDADKPEQANLHDLLQQHQAVCPDCRSYYVQKLAEWKQIIGKDDTISP